MSMWRLIRAIFDLKMGLLFHYIFMLFMRFDYMFDKYEKSNTISFIMVTSLHLNTKLGKYKKCC